MQESKNKQKTVSSVPFVHTHSKSSPSLIKKGDLATLLALQSIKGLGSRKVGWLLSQLESPRDIWSAPDAYWVKVCDPEQAPHWQTAIRETEYQAIRSFANWSWVHQTLRHTREMGFVIIPYQSSLLQTHLGQITDPPIILWAKGDTGLLLKPMIAVVGTRRPSAYAQLHTRRITRDLARKGFVIVSGLARGIDGLAHSECLRHQLPTVAVMGSGLDRIYPNEHKNMAKIIGSKGGLLLSEYPPGTPPSSHHFPQRNRIISGLSHGIIVMESGLMGGSMHTANTGLNQGREVAVLPHSLDNPRGAGNISLVVDGAAGLFTTVEAFIERLPPSGFLPEIPFIYQEEDERS
jgi:DNA processing protein